MKPKFPFVFSDPHLGPGIMPKWKLKLGLLKPRLSRSHPITLGKLSLTMDRLSRSHSLALDIARTSLMALKESSDAFPPLKSAVGSVLALWDIIQQMESCKTLGKDLACRCVNILEAVADAVQPDPRNISPEMLKNIDQFKMLVMEISQELLEHNRATRLSRLANLNRNQARLATFSRKLDEASSLFIIASNLQLYSTAKRTEVLTVQIKASTSQIGDVLASNTKVLEANTKLIYVQTGLFALSLAYGSISHEG
ncbi:hypothetical protein C8J56DRAFT_1171776 [Mycena floridula]|nr:hypothetical protein C8J56DRAFT_1171776 [Mycena floridula]